MTNDEVLRGLSAQDENHKTANDGVTNEEETYAKLTLGSEISKSCPKVLGSVHTYPDIFESATFSFRIQKFPGPHVAYSNGIRPSTRIRWYPDSL